MVKVIHKFMRLYLVCVYYEESSMTKILSARFLPCNVLLLTSFINFICPLVPLQGHRQLVPITNNHCSRARVCPGWMGYQPNTEPHWDEQDRWSFKLTFALCGNLELVKEGNWRTRRNLTHRENTQTPGKRIQTGIEPATIAAKATVLASLLVTLAFLNVFDAHKILKVLILPCASTRHVWP